jgi:high-affinity iron transporter
VSWAEAVPNLLIGLREGLEAGLIVSILLAALRKTAPAGPDGARVSSAPVWLGVLGAVMVAGSFAAVLTFSAGELPSRAQEAVSGLLSVLAVGLVTGMIFWMRRTAASLSAQLRGEVQRAVAIGAGALTITAFLAVGREGLETTLFLWTAARASGSTAAPLAGAGLGLAAATALCWLLYRRAIRLNIGVFFSRTALLLIVIAAGVLAAGLGDLQAAGLLPGLQWVAFDLSAHADPNSWWVSIITGATELAPKMTVLQVVAWLGYLAVVIPLFLQAGQAPARKPATPDPSTLNASAPGWARLAARRPWLVAGVLVLVPAVAAGAVIAAVPSATASAASTVTVTQAGCARDWAAARSGTQTFTVINQSGKAGEINLVNAAGGVVGEIETLGPATSAQLTATLSPGSYAFRCYLSGQAVTASAAIQVAGRTVQAAPAAVKPVTVRDLAGPNQAYQRYAAAQLRDLAGAVARIQADLRRGDLAAARTGWLAAQLAWERTGASYNSFSGDGTAVAGLPGGLPAGVADKNFTGLRRLEYGLWHGQPAAELRPVAATLATDVARVQRNLSTADLAGDPVNLPLRAHEILEDALRDHLSGLDDQGSGAAYPETYADLQVTRAVLGDLSALISARRPGLMGTLNGQLDRLQRALLATQQHGQWMPRGAVPLAQRQAVGGATGALLESLSAVPALLEVPPSR